MRYTCRCQECSRGIDISLGKLLMRSWGVVRPLGRRSFWRNGKPWKGLEIWMCSLSGNYSGCICALKVLRVSSFIKDRRCQTQNGALKKEKPPGKSVIGQHCIK